MCEARSVSHQGSPRHRWEADRTLTADQALQAVRDQFRDVAGYTIEFVGHGWEYDVYRVDAEWAFRFPRRREVVSQMALEAALLTRVAPTLRDLRVGVPEVEGTGTATAFFPYPFSRHRFLPGKPADQVPSTAESRASLATQLAVILSRLHALAMPDMAQIPLATEREGCAEYFAELETIVHDLERWETGDILDHVRHCRGSRPAAPPSPSKPRFIHNDLCPDHLIVNPATGGIVGVLDWTDAAWGDPVLDFVIVPCWLGWAATERALEHYEHHVDDDFYHRLRDSSRLLSLIWLHEAHLRQADLLKHRTWVRRAFGEEPEP